MDGKRAGRSLVAVIQRFEEVPHNAKVDNVGTGNDTDIGQLKGMKIQEARFSK